LKLVAFFSLEQF